MGYVILGTRKVRQLFRQFALDNPDVTVVSARKSGGTRKRRPVGQSFPLAAFAGIRSEPHAG
jgi:hypothetical protein